MEELRERKVVVIGLGASGAAAARFCLGRGALVTAVDDKPAEAFDESLRQALADAGAALELGGVRRATLATAELIVISPGVPPSEALAEAEAAGAQVVSEVELASWFLEAPIVGVTGTNGKSTVTALIGEMLARSGRPTFVGGNFGTPLIEAVGTEAAAAGGALVVELSSFQLERIERLRPAVAVMLNVTEDHLDRYRSMAEYSAAKARLLIAQTEDDQVVVDGDDPIALSLARAGRGGVHRFGRGAGEVHLDPVAIVDEVSGARYPLASLALAGAHNHSNACAAVLAARLAGAEPEAIRAALERFRGLPHRMELVGEAGGVSFFNDSKATNVGAAVAAIQGMARPVVLIAGGRDKGGDYGALRREVEAGARAVVLIGEAADRLEAALAGAAELARAADLDDAVARAARLAQPGDAVVLAPACSSFDMFRNFVDRGESFRRAVSNFLPRTAEVGDLLSEGPRSDSAPPAGSEPGEGGADGQRR